ncbi:MAG TPA: transposase [Gemmatimonadales bacterium]|jgi:REP element-mobilizing transposase RayT
MPVRIYAHLSWTTFARLPLIDERVAEFLCRFLLEEVRRHGARTIEIGVVRDHVHMLLELPAAFDVPRMVQGLKGASARLANRDGLAGHHALQWAPGYDLRSVGLSQLRDVAEYVRGHEQRHGAPRPSGRV